MAEVIKFDKSVLKTLATYKDYERRRDEFRELRRTWVPTKPGELGPGYSAWMCGRRMGDYRFFYELQLAQIHQEAFGGTVLVCSCGLGIDGNFEEDELLNTLGHIDVLTLEVVTVFVFDDKLICQGCGELGEVDEDIEAPDCADLVAKIRAEHNCGFDVSSELRGRVSELIAEAK